MPANLAKGTIILSTLEEPQYECFPALQVRPIPHHYLSCVQETLNLPLYILILTYWRKKLKENIVEKGETAQNEQFHCFPQCFLCNLFLNPFPNKPWFLRVCSTSLLKTMWEKEKLLMTCSFSFFHSVFYPFGELSAVFIKFKIVVCKLFQFGRV